MLKTFQNPLEAPLKDLLKFATLSVLALSLVNCTPSTKQIKEEV
jgi:hypothetical protein